MVDDSSIFSIDFGFVVKSVFLVCSVHFISFCNITLIQSFGFNFIHYVFIKSSWLYIRIQIYIVQYINIQYSNWTNREWSIKWAYYVMHLLYNCADLDVCVFFSKHACVCFRVKKREIGRDRRQMRRKNSYSHLHSQIEHIHIIAHTYNMETGTTLFTFHSKFNECSV